MTRGQLEHERERAAAKADKVFRRRLEALQGELMRDLTAWLATRVQADEAGNIRFTTRNASILQEIPRRIARFMAVRSRNLIGWIVRRMNELFGLNNKYFRSFLEYPERIDNRALSQVMLRIGIDVEKKALIPGGYLSQVFQSQPIATQVAGQVQRGLGSGMSLKAFQAQFREVFTRGTGVLVRHFDRFSRDLFFQFDRAVQNQYADSLGLDYASWAGTLIKSSRCFCERRNNRIYTREEVLSWNNQQWRGKIEGGNVLVDGGGFNCRHFLSWFNRQLAESMAKQRGIEINSFDETGCNERTE